MTVSAGSGAPALPGAALAKFLERRGYPVFEALGIHWAQDRWPFYISLPYQLQLEPHAAEIDLVLRKRRIAGFRYPTAARFGWPGGLYVCSPRNYSIQAVDRKHRAQVKSGLDACEFRDLHPDELLALGFELNVQSIARHRRLGRSVRYVREFVTDSGWERFVAAIAATPEVRVTGAFLDGRLSAYMVGCLDGSWLHLLHKMSRPEDFARHTNHALDFWVLSEAAKQPAIEAVTNGYVAIGSAPGVHQYKRTLGYDVIEHGVGIHLHPALRPLLANRFVVGAAEFAARTLARSGQLELLSRVLRGARMSSQASLPGESGRTTIQLLGAPAPFSAAEESLPNSPPPRRRGMRGGSRGPSASSGSTNS